jgi:hypothetical protein
MGNGMVFFSFGTVWSRQGSGPRLREKQSGMARKCRGAVGQGKVTDGPVRDRNETRGLGRVGPGAPALRRAKSVMPS